LIKATTTSSKAINRIENNSYKKGDATFAFSLLIG
jgi:hypothetical protein